MAAVSSTCPVYPKISPLALVMSAANSVRDVWRPVPSCEAQVVLPAATAAAEDAAVAADDAGANAAGTLAVAVAAFRSSCLSSCLSSCPTRLSRANSRASVQRGRRANRRILGAEIVRKERQALKPSICLGRPAAPRATGGPSCGLVRGLEVGPWPRAAWKVGPASLEGPRAA